MYRIPGTASLKSPRIYPYMEAQANASKVPYAKDIMHSFDFTQNQERIVQWTRKDYNPAHNNNGKTQPRFMPITNKDDK